MSRDFMTAFCSKDGGMSSAPTSKLSGSLATCFPRRSNIRFVRSLLPLHGRNRIFPVVLWGKWQNLQRAPIAQPISLLMKAHGLHVPFSCSSRSACSLSSAAPFPSMVRLLPCCISLLLPTEASREILLPRLSGEPAGLSSPETLLNDD